MKKVDLQELYGADTERQRVRYQKIKKTFQETFGHTEVSFFSAPGRCEMIGNHTDHNGGRVIAAAINMDSIAAAAKNGTNTIRIYSEGYDGEIAVDIATAADMEHRPCSGKEQMTKALAAGIVCAAQRMGFRVDGFDACVTSEVMSSAGVSSSASFEMLLCAMINFLSNDNRFTENDCAAMGSYAENHFWNKASGKMDQLACVTGGAVYMDFADNDNLTAKQLPFSFSKWGHEIVLVNTGKGHADLSDEYSTIPKEMRAVAGAAGGERLCDVSLEKVLAQNVWETQENDRALLRAIHFFTENTRVDALKTAIEEEQVETVKQLMKESGQSSFSYLQNCYCISDATEQKIPLALALSDIFLKGSGISRVHGGGFAGVIMSVVPGTQVEAYKQYMERYFGAGNVFQADIRAYGAVQVVGE